MTVDQLHVLVLEDDYLVADKLAREIRASGNLVVGPFADVHEAVQYSELVEAAILDVRIHDETSFLVADSLIHHEIPFVFLTGYDPQFVPPRFDRRHIYTKPMHAAPLLRDLRVQHQRLNAQATISIETIVREMLFKARTIMPDKEAAERLVQATLLRAIAESEDARMHDHTRERLLELLADEYRWRGKSHLH